MYYTVKIVLKYFVSSLNVRAGHGAEFLCLFQEVKSFSDRQLSGLFITVFVTGTLFEGPVVLQYHEDTQLSIYYLYVCIL